MKRIEVQNEFTKWAEYLANYFGHDLLIYDTEGRLMWGSPARLQLTPKELHNRPSLYPIYKDIAEPIAYYDGSMLTPSEYRILQTIIPFIECQLEEEGA